MVPPGALAAPGEAELQVSGATAAVESTLASLILAEPESRARSRPGDARRRALRERACAMTVQQAPSTMAEGLVVREDGRYRPAAQSQHGTPEVNGRRIPAPGPSAPQGTVRPAMPPLGRS